MQPWQTQTQPLYQQPEDESDAIRPHLALRNSKLVSVLRWPTSGNGKSKAASTHPKRTTSRRARHTTSSRSARSSLDTGWRAIPYSRNQVDVRIVAVCLRSLRLPCLLFPQIDPAQRRHSPHGVITRPHSLVAFSSLFSSPWPAHRFVGGQCGPSAFSYSAGSRAVDRPSARALLSCTGLSRGMRLAIFSRASTVNPLGSHHPQRDKLLSGWLTLLLAARSHLASVHITSFPRPGCSSPSPSFPPSFHPA